MWLTNLDTVVMALFLGSGVILITLLGILILFRFKYKEARLLIYFFFRLVGISMILIVIDTLTLLFRWPNLTDIIIGAILVIFGWWYYSRLLIVFSQFIDSLTISIYIILIIIYFVVFGIQIVMDNNLFFLLSAFLALLIAIDLHFLTISILIKFEGDSS